MSEEPKKEDEKILSRRNFLRGARDLGIAGLAAALYHPFDASAQHLVDSYKSGKRLARTLKEMGIGREAEQELSRLEQELKQVKDLTGQYRVLYDNKSRTVDSLQTIYEKNETISRKAIRAARQLEMSLGDVGRAGEAAKPSWWKKFDDSIIDLANELGRRAGVDVPNARQARQRHEEINRYHRALREAYRNDEDMQQTVTDFLRYLRTTHDQATQQNKVIDENLPTLKDLLKRDYQNMQALEDQGAKITRVIEPKLQRFREDLGDARSDLEDDGVKLRELPSEGTILDNSYTRHALVGLAGLLGVRGAYEIGKQYVKGAVAPILALREMASRYGQKDQSSDHN